MTLIPDWRQAWRMFSVRVAALAVAWSALPLDAQAAVLGAVGIGPERVPGILGLLVIVARLVDQPQLGGKP
jgi:hypothetical protein